MLSRIRKTKEKEKKEEKEKLARQAEVAVVKRQFGDFRFDFLKACRHEIKDGVPPANCPFCKLTTKVIRKHFEEEAEAHRISKLTSLLKRAYMRRNLLEVWGYNQASVMGDIGNHVHVIDNIYPIQSSYVVILFNRTWFRCRNSRWRLHCASIEVIGRASANTS